MGSPARAARCSNVDDDGRCARNAPYSILSVGAVNSFRARGTRQSGCRAPASPFRFGHGAERCCRRNRNDTLRSYRRSSRPMRPELRCLRCADWEVLWVLGLKPPSAPRAGWSSWLVRSWRLRCCCSRRRSAHTRPPPLPTSRAPTRRRPTTTSAASSSSTTSPSRTWSSRSKAAASRRRPSPGRTAAGGCTCPRRTTTSSPSTKRRFPTA